LHWVYGRRREDVERDIDDDALLSFLSLAKGKRAMVRAVPMLSSADKVTAVTAGMRHLPHFVASAEADKETEDADALLGSSLAKWVKTVHVMTAEKECQC
jgi:hypothetical protein